MTKAQDRRKLRYEKQLRKCGFRSWRTANARRDVLIRKMLGPGLGAAEAREYLQLKRLADYWQKYRTNDQLGRAIRRLQRLEISLTKT